MAWWLVEGDELVEQLSSAASQPKHALHKRRPSTRWRSGRSWPQVKQRGARAMRTRRSTRAAIIRAASPAGSRSRWSPVGCAGKEVDQAFQPSRAETQGRHRVVHDGGFGAVRLVCCIRCNKAGFQLSTAVHCPSNGHGISRGFSNVSGRERW
ncbi:MAG: hypothetical protein JWQ26_3972 [Modestobacter sp.]|jgi:hypothetical protein|nr:hypothetical protein [Modestobacter sp.]